MNKKLIINYIIALIIPLVGPFFLIPPQLISFERSIFVSSILLSPLGSLFTIVSLEFFIKNLGIQFLGIMDIIVNYVIIPQIIINIILIYLYTKYCFKKNYIIHLLTYILLCIICGFIGTILFLYIPTT